MAQGPPNQPGGHLSVSLSGSEITDKLFEELHVC